MRLDHVSYVASHDQISDVVNRIGSQIGTAFIDGGIHPKFGTRNFTAPLLNGQYIEIVCPLDHPATDTNPFGQAVKKKAEAGGGWLSWVCAVRDIKFYEKLFESQASLGRRIKPNGTELLWRQIGMEKSFNNVINPYFIEWIDDNHPSHDGYAVAELLEIQMNYPTEKTLEDLKRYQINEKIAEKINLVLDLSQPTNIARIKLKTLNRTIEIE